MKSVRLVDPYDHINPMENINADTHLVDTHKEHTREYHEEKEIFDDVNESTISEEKSENIHPYIENNLPSTKMNLGLMTLQHNHPDNFIDNP